MKKQTATEWLFAHLLPFLEFSDSKEREHFRKCLAEARILENEQHYESYRAGNSFTNSDSLDFKDFFDEYYYKTYGGKK
jgi:hypothetical protein